MISPLLFKAQCCEELVQRKLQLAVKWCRTARIGLSGPALNQPLAAPVRLWPRGIFLRAESGEHRGSQAGTKALLL